MSDYVEGVAGLVLRVECQRKKKKRSRRKKKV